MDRRDGAAGPIVIVVSLSLAALGWGLALVGTAPRPAVVRARLSAPTLSARLNASMVSARPEAGTVRAGASGSRSRSTRRSDTALPVVGATACGLLCVGLGGLPGAVVAAAIAPVAFAVLRRQIARTPAAADRTDRAALPMTCDLVAAGLRAGASVPTALTSAAGTAPGSVRTELNRVAALLRLGTSAAQAWSGLVADPVLGPVALVAARSADSGIRLADALTRRAARLRDDLQSDAVARAERVGVVALVPLGLCFLPAFICLGVVPIVAGIAADVFSQVAP